MSNVKTSAPLVTSYKEKDPAPLIACLQVWSVAKSLVKSIKLEVVWVIFKVPVNVPPERGKKGPPVKSPPSSSITSPLVLTPKAYSTVPVRSPSP